MPKTIERKAYTMQETAQMLGISELTVRRMIERGNFASYKLQKRRLIPADSLDAYLASVREG